MTLDQVILHCEEVADRCAVTDGNRKCEADHRQLAEWLRELKAYKGKYHKYYVPRYTLQKEGGK